MINKSDSKRPPLIILRNNDCCFLGILRSCAKAGIPVIPVIYTWPEAKPWFSEHSKHFNNAHTIPNPYSHPNEARDAFLAFIKACYQQWQTRLMVIPSSDTGLLFLYDNFADFSPYILLNGDENFSKPRYDVVNKFTCAQQLAEAGFNIPDSHLCESAKDIEKIVNNICYPCLYKPVMKDYGQQFYAKHKQEKAIRCDSPAMLREKLLWECEQGFVVIVQQLIEFAEPTDEVPAYLYVDAKQQIRLACTGLKECIVPAPFGTATRLRLSWHAELLPMLVALVTALKWRGILMVECIRDRQGQWQIIELNPRPWLFIDFFRRVGFNYLDYLYADLMGELADYPALVHPTPEQANHYLHVDLAADSDGWQDRDTGQITLLLIETQLNGLAGEKSFCYLDPKDLGPGYKQLENFSEQHQLDSPALSNIMRVQTKDLSY